MIDGGKDIFPKLINMVKCNHARDIIKAQLMLSLSNNQALGDKIGELVAKDVTHNTQVTTNHSGLIKYSCGYKELKDFTFDFEAGVDKKPCAQASPPPLITILKNLK
jgi:hypothetical protein